jgi:hypothetical protein
MRSLPAAAILQLALLSLPACSSGDSPRSSPAIPATSAASTDSPFARRDVPPADVAALLNFSPAGDGPCSRGTRPTSPTIQTQTSSQLGWPNTICLDGFPPGVTVAIRLFDPNGTVVHEDAVSIQSGLGVSSIRDLDPRGPVGDYLLLVSYGDFEQGVTVTYSRADKPRVTFASRGLSSIRTSPGSVIDYRAVGFPPNSTVPVALYAQRDRLTFVFAAMLPPLQPDGFGVTEFSLRTSPSDSGCYMVVPQISVGGKNPFLQGDEGRPTISSFQHDLQVCLSS